MRRKLKHCPLYGAPGRWLYCLPLFIKAWPSGILTGFRAYTNPMS